MKKFESLTKWKKDKNEIIINFVLIGGLKPGVGKFTAAVGNNRRALSAINRNIIGAPPYPCAVHKRAALAEYEFLEFVNLIMKKCSVFVIHF